MRWQDKSVPFEELASVPTPNTFINWQRDRTFVRALQQRLEVFSQHQQRGHFGQCFLLAPQLTLELIVLTRQLAKDSSGLLPLH